jgi:hypothetical protein
MGLDLATAAGLDPSALHTESSRGRGEQGKWRQGVEGGARAEAKAESTAPVIPLARGG